MLDKCIARGRTAEIYTWEKDLVLKLFYDFIPVEAIDGEFNKTSIIRKKTELCPGIYERVTIREGEGIIYENLKGNSITYNLLNNPLRVKELSGKMAQCHRDIHNIIVEELPEIKNVLRRCISESSFLELDQKPHLIDILDSFQDGDRLCHMNFHPGNVFLTEDGPRVIDWMNSGKGNPLADVAMTVVQLRFSSVPFQNALFRGVVKLSREILIKEYLGEYFKDGFHQEDILHKWMLVIAAARTNERLPESETEKLTDFIREEM
ncbi:MAG: aminoglycoside phosphotransferase family protein [Bacillota bacterium]